MSYKFLQPTGDRMVRNNNTADRKTTIDSGNGVTVTKVPSYNDDGKILAK